jgi:hypothetical protein
MRLAWPDAALCVLLCGIAHPAMAQERNFSVVFPELQYTRHCSSEIEIHNVSQRFVDFEVVGHQSSGAVTALVERKTNRFHLAPSELIAVRLEVQNDVAWAEVIETVPSTRLNPTLAIGAFTECLDGTERITEPREIAPVVRDLSFTLIQPAAPSSAIFLLINASDSRMLWSACYSGGSTVSNEKGEMVPLCSETLERTLAPYQSWRLTATINGKPLVQFHSTGSAVAMQLLTQSAPSATVQSRIYHPLRPGQVRPVIPHFLADLNNLFSCFVLISTKRKVTVNHRFAGVCQRSVYEAQPCRGGGPRSCRIERFCSGIP